MPRPSRRLLRSDVRRRLETEVGETQAQPLMTAVVVMGMMPGLFAGPSSVGRRVSATSSKARARPSFVGFRFRAVEGAGAVAEATSRREVAPPDFQEHPTFAFFGFP